jgi:hypothetical protein
MSATCGYVVDVLLIALSFATHQTVEARATGAGTALNVDGAAPTLRQRNHLAFENNSDNDGAVNFVDGDDDGNVFGFNDVSSMLKSKRRGKNIQNAVDPLLSAETNGIAATHHHGTHKVSHSGPFKDVGK